MLLAQLGGAVSGSALGAGSLAAFDRVTLVLLAEETVVEDAGLREGLFEQPEILFSSHPEVGEVVEELSEDPHAVAGVGPGVQDMLVPEGVHVAGRYHLVTHIDGGHVEVALVAHLDRVDLLLRPVLALRWIHELALDHGQVEAVDELEGGIVFDSASTWGGLLLG